MLPFYCWFSTLHYNQEHSLWFESQNGYQWSNLWETRSNECNKHKIFWERFKITQLWITKTGRWFITTCDTLSRSERKSLAYTGVKTTQFCIRQDLEQVLKNRLVQNCFGDYCFLLFYLPRLNKLKVSYQWIQTPPRSTAAGSACCCLWRGGAYKRRGPCCSGRAAGGWSR